jgi:hypothetical protein
VNILKDQAEDEKIGRMLVPSREQLEASAGADAREALEFLCSIPAEQIEFRQFCGWSLFLGIETLVVAKANSLKRMLSKISRTETSHLLEQIDAMITDNSRLKDFFFQRASQLNWPTAQANLGGEESPDWLTQIYRGRLDRQSLSKLGLA